MCRAKYTLAGYKTFMTKIVRKVYNEPFAMMLPEASLTAIEGPRCPSCEATNPPGREACRECGTRLFPCEAAGPLPENLPPPSLAERADSAFVPVECEMSGAPRGKKLLDVDGELKVDRAEMVEKESYMCLICGTIFVSETEAHTFSGIPVARVVRKGEPEALEARRPEVPRAEDDVSLERPPPRPLSAGALMAADILPVHEPTDGQKAVVRKKVVKRTVRK